MPRIARHGPIAIRRFSATGRIVVYRLGSLGDTVVALPCLHAIEGRLPARGAGDADEHPRQLEGGLRSRRSSVAAAWSIASSPIRWEPDRSGTCSTCAPPCVPSERIRSST